MYADFCLGNLTETESWKDTGQDTNILLKYYDESSVVDNVMKLLF